MSEIFLIIGEAKALCCNYTLEMSDFLRKEEVRYMVINARTKHNYTPLMFASVYNKAESVKFLIDNGASVDCRNDNGDNALFLARQTEDESVIAILVGASAK